jgi:hypothetical protein
MIETTKKKIGKWPWLIVLIGVLFLGLTSWAIVMAARGTSPVTDPAYYSHGLRYNQSRIETLAAESMNWRVSSSLKGNKLTITLKKGGQQPVSGCRGELVIYSSEERLVLAMQEKSHGSYTTEIPGELSGNLTGDLILQRDGARINRRLLINLP